MTVLLPRVGWIGLGDQGAPMARAVAEAGYPLHVWARRRSSLDVLAGVPYQLHDTVADLGADSDIVGLCLGDDPDVREVATTGGLLESLEPGAVLVNHGTGLPAFAAELAELAMPYRVEVVDAPVSGGHVGAVEKRLTVLAGGDPEVVAFVRPVFATFATTVAHLGGHGAGQIGKLLNNTLLMANQQNIAELLDVAGRLGLDLPALLDAIRAGTGSSVALQSLGRAITPDNAEHLSRLQLIDMDIYRKVVAPFVSGLDPLTERAVAGAQALPRLARLTFPPPTAAG
ncbi:NAD(P)-dependent oxidoreductase [Paractinoplanes hotanensis]|uniref:NAD(P)-dependent oxidoreductase n=1 Tax=Paractinoplanes hotanensis TaxID=2906497 RepID=A0ABT0Y8C5_9ACTN|nr:NAD(P)-dependent oxidoreductase [Actinoplanes hotanensis]MCM4082286.1 NAD(P)-dependent oxidoreductase [Actinoplanes hotanensis]